MKRSYNYNHRRSDLLPKQTKQEIQTVFTSDLMSDVLKIINERLIVRHNSR